MSSENDPIPYKKPHKKAGRHALSPGKPMKVMVSSRVDEVTHQKMLVLGHGHASEGLRVAVDYAYDQLQKGRFTLEPKT